MLRLLLENNTTVYTIENEREATMRQELAGNRVTQVDEVEAWHIYVKLIDGIEIDVCTNDINNAFEYIINRVGFIDEVSFTRR